MEELQPWTGDPMVFLVSVWAFLGFFVGGGMGVAAALYWAAYGTKGALNLVFGRD